MKSFLEKDGKVSSVVSVWSDISEFSGRGWH